MKEILWYRLSCDSQAFRDFRQQTNAPSSRCLVVVYQHALSRVHRSIVKIPKNYSPDLYVSIHMSKVT